ncbi:hypothetical protein CEXT_810051, partial [Caerostris extrusa]
MSIIPDSGTRSSAHHYRADRLHVAIHTIADSRAGQQATKPVITVSG